MKWSLLWDALLPVLLPLSDAQQQGFQDTDLLRPLTPYLKESYKFEDYRPMLYCDGISTEITIEHHVIKQPLKDTHAQSASLYLSLIHIFPKYLLQVYRHIVICKLYYDRILIHAPACVLSYVGLDI